MHQSIKKLKIFVMPGFDQKGPMGRGPMTGWRMGRCASSGEKAKEQPAASENDVAENEENIFRGRGWRSGFRGRGPGRGMGRRNRFRGSPE